MHSKELEYTLLDLFETVVVFFEHVLSLFHRYLSLGELAPRQVEYGIEVILDNEGFLRSGRELHELVCFFKELLAALLVYFEFNDVVDIAERLVLIVLAELFLNYPHLLAEVILLLPLVDAVLGLLVDKVLEPEYLHLGRKTGKEH